MQIPSDFRLDAATFEDVLDLEAGVRLAANARAVPLLSGMEQIHDAWIVLEGRLPESVDHCLSSSMKRMLDAFNARNEQAMRHEQIFVAERLNELRKAAA